MSSGYIGGISKSNVFSKINKGREILVRIGGIATSKLKKLIVLEIQTSSKPHFGRALPNSPSLGVPQICLGLPKLRREVVLDKGVPQFGEGVSLLVRAQEGEVERITVTVDEDVKLGL